YDRARDFLERALAEDPQASSLHYPLAMAYRGLGISEKVEAHLRQRGDVAVATPDPLMHAVAQLLQSPMSYETSGREALMRGEWQPAAADFRKGIALAGENASIQAVLHQQLGTALYQMGDVRGALDEFQQAVRWSPR